jgi:hypothetical protein
MSEKPSGPPSWWQTLPGILTGIAALITAVTGLIVVFNRTGNRSEDTRPASLSVPVGAQPGSPAESRTPGPAGGAGRAESIALPALSRVKLGGGVADVTILSAQIEPLDVERRSLKFRVRYLNGGRYPANFWSDSYRLIVDDVPRAPTNLLNEVVPGDSAKEGEVIFELPVSAKDVVLQISSGEEKSRLPFTLP